MANLLFEKRGDNSFVMAWARGELKQELLKMAGPRPRRTPGTPHEIDLDHEGGFALRAYQNDAVKSFFDHGSGVVVLPWRDRRSPRSSS